LKVGYVLLSDPFDNVEKTCLLRELLSLTKANQIITQNTTPSFFEQSSHCFPREENNMSFIRINQTLIATLFLVACVLLLSIPMSEGLLVVQENRAGSLRRQQQVVEDRRQEEWEKFLPPSVNVLSAVKLLTAGKFAVLSKAGVTTTGTTIVNGDMGTSPIAATAVTGFELIADPSNAFSKSKCVNNGNIYAANFAPPTPSMLTVAVLDMQTAYVDAAGRPDPDYTELGAGSIEGYNLGRGLYKWGSGVEFSNSLTFNGTATDIWILQIAGDVTVGNGASVLLTGGAKPENIFWQIAGKTILGIKSHVEGILMCSTAITFMAGSSMNGTALAQTSITLDSAVIVKNSVCDAVVGCVESH
jgi:hypothetical protein